MDKKIKEYLGKSKKARGFTLVEMIAVLAIIAILFAVFTPKVAGYIKEAKKTKALEEVRKVVLAIDTYNIKASDTIGVSEIYKNIKDKISSSSNSSELIDFAGIKSISDSMTYEKMKELLGGGSFTLSENGIISYS